MKPTCPPEPHLGLHLDDTPERITVSDSFLYKPESIDDFAIVLAQPASEPVIADTSALCGHSDCSNRSEEVWIDNRALNYLLDSVLARRPKLPFPLHKYGIQERTVGIVLAHGRDTVAWIITTEPQDRTADPERPILKRAQRFDADGGAGEMPGAQNGQNSRDQAAAFGTGDFQDVALEAAELWAFHAGVELAQQGAVREVIANFQIVAGGERRIDRDVYVAAVAEQPDLQPLLGQSLAKEGAAELAVAVIERMIGS